MILVGCTETSVVRLIRHVALHLEYLHMMCPEPTDLIIQYVTCRDIRANTVLVYNVYFVLRATIMNINVSALQIRTKFPSLGITMCPFSVHSWCSWSWASDSTDVWNLCTSRWIIRKKVELKWRKIKWPRRDSNTQPSDLESDALPLRHGVALA